MQYFLSLWNWQALQNKVRRAWWFDDFPILAQETNKFLLEIKESLLIKCDKPILNKNISSAPLFLFDKA